MLRARALVRRSLMLTVLAQVLMVLSALPAAAFPSKLSTNGQLDFTYGSSVQSSGGPGTTYKPESKLFYTGDGTAEAVRWWAVLGTSGPSPAAGVWLFELVDHAWVARVQLPGADAWAKADVVFDGATAYVSTRDNASSVSGNPRESDLWEIPYLGGGSWDTVSGPFLITTSNPETLTIAKDSTGRLWTTYESGGAIKVGYTSPGGTSFSFTTVSATDVYSDDISAVTAFGGNRIGVFWSDQIAKKDFFAIHPDSAGPTSSWTIETAYGGGVGGCPTSNSDLCADDHMNVKVYGDQVYVAVKTSLNDVSGGANDPLIALLRRSSNGTWTSYPVSPVSQDATRPVTVLSPAQDAIWVWATVGSEVDVWESSFTSPGFTSGAYVPWIKGSSSANDSTSTKQLTTAATGTVVAASVSSKDQYWHNEFLPQVPNTTPTAQDVTTATSVNTAKTVTLTGTDPETCELTFSPAATSAQGGTVSSLSSPSNNCTAGSPNQDTATVTYAPPSGFTGQDSFTFTTTDGGGLTSAAAMVSINVTSTGTGISFRASSSAANSTAKTLTIPQPSGVQAGDVMVSAVAVRGGPVVTPPSGWTLIRTDQNGSTDTVATFEKVATASEPSDYTWSFSARKSAAGGIVAYAGVDTTNPIDTDGGQTNTASKSITAPSVTTTAAGDLVVGIFQIVKSNSVTPPASMVERYDQASSTGKTSLTIEAADETVPTAGATGTRVATATLVGKNIGQLIALRPAGP